MARNEREGASPSPPAVSERSTCSAFPTLVYYEREQKPMTKPDAKTAEQAGGATLTSNSAKDGKKKRSKDAVAALAGIAKDDPTWDEFMEAMKRARAEEEAQEDVSR